MTGNIAKSTTQTGLPFQPLTQLKLTVNCQLAIAMKSMIITKQLATIN